MTFDNEYSILCSCAVFLNWTRPCSKNKAHNVRGQLSCKNCWKSIWLQWRNNNKLIDNKRLKSTITLLFLNNICPHTKDTKGLL